MVRRHACSFGTPSFANYKYSVYCTYKTGDSKSSVDQPDINFDMLNKEIEAIKTNPKDIGKCRVLIYPNPTEGNVTVSWETSYEDKLVLTIYDLQGRLVKTVQIEPYLYNIEVDLHGSKGGIYLFVLKDMKNGMIINRSRILKY